MTHTTSTPEAHAEHVVPLRAFRDALGHFVTGVTVVTAMSESGRPVGLTVNSFNSVSLSPPLVLWSLARHAGSVPVFTQVSHYAIHVLSADQLELAQRFATRDIDRFAGHPWTPGLGNAPLLSGAAAVFECSNHSQYHEGDHIILVGGVQRIHARDHAAPLVFHQGQMHAGWPLNP